MYLRRLVENGYEHALRLFREKDTSVVRLQASVLRGELKRKPVWTAFVTNQIRVPGWALRYGRREVLLADLQQFVFMDEYNPQRTSTDEFKLTFFEVEGTKPALVVMIYILTRSDADDFMSSIEAFENIPKSQDQAVSSDESRDS